MRYSTLYKKRTSWGGADDGPGVQRRGASLQARRLRQRISMMGRARRPSPTSRRVRPFAKAGLETRAPTQGSFARRTPLQGMNLDFPQPTALSKGM